MKIRMLLALLLALFVLQGCNKSSSNSSTASPSAVRLVNATTNYQSLDLTSSGAVLASAVAYGTASSYAAVASGASTFTLNIGGTSTTVGQTTLLLSSSVSYTLLAYTSGQQLQLAAFADNEVAPASGYGKIRLLSLAPDAGSVDVYMAAAGGTLSTASVLATNFTGTTGYSQIIAGTYQIWVTGAGNQADLRLVVPSIVISDQQILSLILTGTTGGTLVNGLLVTQSGAVSAQQNSSARVRLVANIAANGSITATANGVSLGSNLTSPAVGSYALVPAGALSLSVAVNGSTVNTGSLNLTAAPGADLTLLAAGIAASPQFSLLNEDNRLAASGLAKLRLANGVNGLADNISLFADYNPLVTNVAPGTVSAAASINAGTIFQLQVNSSQANTLLYQATNVTVQSPGVYSLFMLGSNTAPVGVLRRDR